MKGLVGLLYLQNFNWRFIMIQFLVRLFHNTTKDLRGSLPKSGPLDFATKNTFPLFFVSEEALAGIY